MSSSNQRRNLPLLCPPQLQKLSQPPPPTPNLMVAAAAAVAAYVVEAELNPLPSHTVVAPPLPPSIAMGEKVMAVADDEGKFVMGGCGDFDNVGVLASIAAPLALTSNDVS